MSICIETERLILRQFSIDDAIELQELCNEAYILKWMPDWETSLNDRKRWLEWISTQYSIATKLKATISLAVTLKSNSRMIGMIAIQNKEEVDNEIEIAYFISEKFTNKGYISEAAKAIIEWVFNSLTLDYLIAIVELDNFPSQRVIQKCGFIKLETKMIFNSGENQEKPFYYYRLYNSTIKDKERSDSDNMI